MSLLTEARAELAAQQVLKAAGETPRLTLPRSAIVAAHELSRCAVRELLNGIDSELIERVLNHFGIQISMGMVVPDGDPVWYPEDMADVEDDSIDYFLEWRADFCVSRDSAVDAGIEYLISSIDAPTILDQITDALPA